MDPKVWGPHAWVFLHSITFVYPENPSYHEQKKMYDFFNSLKYVLPCNSCRVHFRQNLKNNALAKAVTSRDELIAWLIKLHNNVNRSTGKQELKSEQVGDIYNAIYKNQKPNKIVHTSNWNSEIGLGVGFFIIIAIYLISSKNTKLNL